MQNDSTVFSDPPAPESLDTANRFLVAAQGTGDGFRTLIQRFRQVLTKDEAINLAAWLVAMSDHSPGHETFDRLLEAIENT